MVNKQQKYPIQQAELNVELPSIEKEPRFNVKILKNIKNDKHTITLRLEKPKGFKFKPGQYVWLIIPGLTKGDNVIDRRAYSIASGIAEKYIDLVINITKSHYVSSLKSLKSGETVSIIGPMGSFVPPSSGVIMITSKFGLPQLISSLKSETVDNLSMIMCGVKNTAHNNNDDSNNTIGTKNPKIIYLKSKPRPSDLVKFVGNERPIFISGTQNFVNYIYKTLLLNDIEEERMYFGENYPQNNTDKSLISSVGSMAAIEYKHDSKLPNKLNDLFLQAAKNTNSHVILTDRNGHILFANQAAFNLTGYSYNEMKGQTPRLWGGLLPEEVYKELWLNLQKGIAVKTNVINRQKSGRLYIASVVIIPIKYSGVVIAYVAAEDDITTLSETDKAKTEFIPIISHQLKTLLSVISWYTEMLIDGDAGKLSGKQKKYIETIYNGNQHMVELLNSLLNITRIELGALSVELASVDLIDLVHKIISEQKTDIDRKKIKISYLADDEIPIIQADPKLLRMIIQNLLSNAIKYSHDRGDISISLTKHNNNLLFKISDKGCGIPKSQHSKIFAKLFRADNAIEMDQEGTGLGLYIVKSVVEKIKGKIWFKSSENKGSTFFVSIPISPKNKSQS